METDLGNPVLENFEAFTPEGWDGSRAFRNIFLFWLGPGELQESCRCMGQWMDEAAVDAARALHAEEGDVLSPEIAALAADSRYLAGYIAHLAASGCEAPESLDELPRYLLLTQIAAGFRELADQLAGLATGVPVEPITALERNAAAFRARLYGPPAETVPTAPAPASPAASSIRRQPGPTARLLAAAAGWLQGWLGRSNRDRRCE